MGVALQKQLLLDALGQNGVNTSMDCLVRAILDEGVLALPGGQSIELGGLLPGQQAC